MELLFRNVTVLPMDDTLEERVLRNMCIGIDKGKIAYFGAYEPSENAGRVVEGENLVVIPGLINAHSHIPMILLRGSSNDVPLEEWLFEHIFPREAKLTGEDIHAGSLLGMLEAISTGTTALCDMYMNLDAIASAAEKVGIRLHLTNALTSFDENENLEENRSFLQNRLIREKYRDSCLIKSLNGIHAVYTSYPRAWERVRKEAEENGKPINVHVSETKTEQENCIEKYGTTPLQTLDRYGVLDVGCIAAHCVYLTDEDIELMREKNVTAVHCPTSNLMLASGIADVSKYIKRGVNVALGTDGAASNNSLDMFEEMKLASLLQKGISLDPTAISAYDALKMATVNGAKALRLNSGVIKEGCNADLAVLDFSRIGLTPCYDHVANVVYSANGSDVAMTVIDGKIVYEYGRFACGIDIGKLRKAVEDGKK